MNLLRRLESSVYAVQPPNHLSAAAPAKSLVPQELGHALQETCVR